MAIIEYLDEKYPEPPFLPADAAGRARVRALAQLIACEIHPVNNLRVLKYLTSVPAQEAAGIDLLLRGDAHTGGLLPGAANLQWEAIQRRF